MQKKLAFFLFASLIGILLLFYLSSFLPPEKLAINQITKETINKEIQINAKIINVKDYEAKSFQIIMLEDETGKIQALANSNKQLPLNKNQTYIFIGKIQENSYNQTKTLQLIINKILEKR